jgi:hypothetical protein
MKRILLLLATLLAMTLPEAAPAQVVTQLPQFVAPRAVLDLGNGPMELKMLQGAIGLFTSQGSGTGSTSGSSTTLALTAVPTTAPCVGCIISGAGITSGTTVSAYNGVTNITLSAAMTVASNTAVAWGAACPTPAVGAATPQVQLQAGQGGNAGQLDIPLYTQARVCAAGHLGEGGLLVTFPIGAH